MKRGIDGLQQFFGQAMDARPLALARACDIQRLNDVLA